MRAGAAPLVRRAMVRKRPAAALGGHVDVSASVARVASILEGHGAIPDDHPPWEEHALQILADCFSWARGGAPMVLNVWSDCAGSATEIFAGGRLSAKLKELFDVTVTFQLYGFSERNDDAFKFVKAHHKPRHGAKDVLARDWASGAYECCLCNCAHTLPPNGLDVYVAGFPCSPWTARGQRRRLEDC